MNSGIPVFIFCSAEYHYLIDKCANSVQDHVLDKVSSITVVTNKRFDDTEFNVILDDDFWNILDPKFEFRNIYNHNWVKQQLFKLQLDEYVVGDYLVIDADVWLHRDIQWVENGKTTFVLLSDPDTIGWHDKSSNLVKALLGINSLQDKTYVNDCMLMNTEVTKQLRREVEQRFNKSWLQIISDFVIDKPNEFVMSEFELYGNYFRVNYPDLVLNDFSSLRTQFDGHGRILTTHLGTQTKWLTFYKQVRGVDWPDCWDEEEFKNLPAHIQDECITVFGYTPKL